MADSSSSFTKWIGGIIATIFTGLILWWLTGPLSPFKTKVPPPEKKPHVVITQFNLKSPIYIGQFTTAEFEVTNEGNSPAIGCQLIWETPGLNGSVPSEQMSLDPGEKKSFSLSSGAFTKEGTISTTARLNCSNSNSENLERPVVVYFMVKPPDRH